MRKGILPEFYVSIVFHFISFDKDTSKKDGFFRLFILYFKPPSSHHACDRLGIRSFRCAKSSNAAPFTKNVQSSS